MYAGSDVVHGWNPSFWRQIGLGDLADEGFARIGTVVLSPGEAVGAGLTEEVGGELGLPPGTPVATAIIDAHAGGLGQLSINYEDRSVGIAVSTVLYKLPCVPLCSRHGRGRLECSG